MATFTYPTDQNRLQIIFGLGRDQRYSSSQLWVLMKNAEQFDDQESQTTVTEIKALMDALDDATTGLITQLQSNTDGNIQSVSVSGEYSASFGAGGKSTGLVRQIETKKAQIRALLDPDGQLNKYQRAGRVMAG